MKRARETRAGERNLIGEASLATTRNLVDGVGRRFVV
jgi:hypothetical protein